METYLISLAAALVGGLLLTRVTKRSLLAVGEIQPEGRVSARKLNPKHPKVHHLPTLPHHHDGKKLLQLGKQKEKKAAAH